MDENKVIFVIGSERSGSTLLRLMLSSHPQIHILNDGPHQAFIEKCIEKEKSKRYYTRDSFTRFDFLKEKETIDLINADIPVIEKIHQLLRQKQMKNKDYIGLQIHEYYEVLKKAFPKAKYIHLVRDPRPVCLSRIAMGWHGNYYCAAKAWLNSIKEVKNLQAELPKENFFEIKYENLLQNPKKILNLVYLFIGISYTDQMFDYAEYSTYTYPNPSNIDKWKKNMKFKDIRQVEVVALEEMRCYGYSPLCPEFIKPSRFAVLYLLIDDKVKKIISQIKYFGFKNYILTHINKLLGQKIFKEAEKYILKKQIENIK